MRIFDAPRWTSPLFAAAVCLAWAAPPAASAPAAPPAPLVTVMDRDLNANDVEAYLGDLVASKLTEHNIPGATISVVKDRSLLFSSGYGFADLENNRPVVASETLFRIGSVTKLLTWTAVMQLVEQGKIDLDEDLNAYLGEFEIPATYPEPITMAQLMTHTAGFEDRQLGISVVDQDAYRPLASFLATDMPDRIYSPGSVTAYSNYGAALAAHIVERLSGERIEDYIERHILDPLEMADSSLQQVLPAHLAANLATSYQEVAGQPQPLPREYFQIVGAAGISATATDMANFMIAHLDDGKFGDTRLLEPSTVSDMHRQHFTNDPRLAGMAYGFAELELSNQRALIHTGSTNFEQFHSYMVLLPDHDAGLFVSFNGDGGAAAKHEVVRAFLDRYYPQPAPAPVQAVDGYVQRASRFVGTYQPTRTTESNLEKIVGLVSPAIQVSANADGSITITGGPIAADAGRWIEVEPLLFRQIDGWDEVAFGEDSGGNVASMFIGSLPIVAFTMQQWWQAGALHLGLLASSMLVFVSAVLILPIAWVFARRRRSSSRSASGRARGLAWLTSLLFIAFAIVFAIGIADLEEGIGPVARAALVIALAATMLTVGLIATVASAWKHRSGGMIGRVHLSVVMLSAVSFVWFLNYWNLLGIRL